MPTKAQLDWTEEWLGAVAQGRNTMSQRKLTSVRSRGGGIIVAKVTAKRLGLHLLLLTGDDGADIVAASSHPFKVLC